MTMIECERTWNPIVGCSRVSAGCMRCYAERDAWRLANNPKTAALYGDLVRQTSDGPRWTGQVRLNERALLTPLRVKQPTVWFVNSMSDLFHENVPDAWIDRAIAVMHLADWHRFIVLTKRTVRLHSYLSRPRARNHMRRVAIPTETGDVALNYWTE